MAYQYDFLLDSFKEAPFTVYLSAPTIQLPLMDSPLDISDWAVGITPEGIPIAKDVNNPVTPEETSESFLIEPPKAQAPAVSTPTYSKTYKASYNLNNAMYVMNKLITKGFAPHVAAGIVGNLIAESSVNPKSYNKYDVNGVSGGIAQWHKGNFVKLQNFARSRNKSWKDLDTQIDFLISTIDKDVMQRLLKARNYHEASEAWAYYEKYAGYDGTTKTAKAAGWKEDRIKQEHEKRSSFSNQIYNLWKNK